MYTNIFSIKIYKFTQFIPTFQPPQNPNQNPPLSRPKHPYPIPPKKTQKQKTIKEERRQSMIKNIKKTYINTGYMTLVTNTTTTKTPAKQQQFVRFSKRKQQTNTVFFCSFCFSLLPFRLFFSTAYCV